MFKNWFYLPALLFLLITLLSGTWLRIQWGWPQWQLLGFELPWSLFFRADYLLHGHSHVALLGWVFPGLMGLVLEAGTRRSHLPQTGLRLLAALTIFVTLLLFIAFVGQGYAPLSIALSTIHMLLGYALAWIFFRHAREDSNTGSRYFLEGAVFWMVMATAGPWLLAIGRGLPPFWMDAAVHYYLHVLFNGWFLFGLAGLSYRYLVTPAYRQCIWPFWLMMAGLIPALLPALQSGLFSQPVFSHEMAETSGMMSTSAGSAMTVGSASGDMAARSVAEAAWQLAGVAGTALFAIGGLAVVWITIQSLLMKKRALICRELLWVGLMAAVPVLILPVPMALPAVRSIWMQSDFLIIGFIHLHLLVMVTSLLLFAVLQRSAGHATASGERSGAGMTPQQERGLLSRSVGDVAPVSDRMSIRQSILRAGSLIYIGGILLMVTVLFITGYFQISGILPPYPVQKLPAYTGMAALTGVALLIFSSLRKANR